MQFQTSPLHVGFYTKEDVVLCRAHSLFSSLQEMEVHVNDDWQPDPIDDSSTDENTSGVFLNYLKEITPTVQAIRSTCGMDEIALKYNPRTKMMNIQSPTMLSVRGEIENCALCTEETKYKINCIRGHAFCDDCYNRVDGEIAGITARMEHHHGELKRSDWNISNALVDLNIKMMERLYAERKIREDMLKRCMVCKQEVNMIRISMPPVFEEKFYAYEFVKTIVPGTSPSTFAKMLEKSLKKFRKNTVKRKCLNTVKRK